MYILETIHGKFTTNRLSDCILKDNILLHAVKERGYSMRIHINNIISITITKFIL